MHVSPLINTVNSPSAATAPATSTTPAGSSTSTDPTSSLANESTFLKLLMAQVQNQDPMNPTDSTQFVGQLVSFSQLEQLLSNNQGVQTLVTTATPPTPSPSPTPSPTPTPTTTTANSIHLATQ